jgi:hypothetical protein
VLVVESCHSTWLFDERRHRFRRLLKGIVADSRDASTEWRSYERLELDDRAGTIKVVLNPSGTRLVRAEMHANRCRRCYGDPTGEISLDDLRALVGA